MRSPIRDAPGQRSVAASLAELANLPVTEVLRVLHTPREGLAGDEAARRLAAHGPNLSVTGTHQSPIVQLGRQFTQFFSVILSCAAVLALVAEHHEPGQGMARVAIAIVVVILTSGVFAFVQERRVERTLAALQRLLPPRVAALREGCAVEIPIADIVVGDIVLLGTGDVPPADCRLTESFALRVDMASLTGEALPVSRDAQPCSMASSGGDPLRCTNLLLAGTSIVSGQARAVVCATGAHTELGRIARLSTAHTARRSPLQDQLAHLSLVIGMLSVAIGVALFSAGAAIGVPTWQGLLFAIGIIVAMVPEGLQPTLTLSLVLAAQRMARRQVLVRHLPSVETLGRTTVICTDKTGTLTQNRMQVRELLIGLQRSPVHGPLDTGGAPAAPASASPDRIDLYTVARLCHDLKATRIRGAGDPVDIALEAMSERARSAMPFWDRVDELAFDTDRMRQSVVFATPMGRTLLCKGAPEKVLACCSFYADGDSERPLDEAARQRIVDEHEAMARRGLRVLAFASRRLPASCQREASEQDMVFLGLAGLEDALRPQAPEAIRRCREAGIRVIMVTGDHPRTASAVACAVGLAPPSGPKVTTGDELRAMSDAALEHVLAQPDVLFARVSAEQKLRIVERLMACHEIVAVTGDGVNDAPALSAAHIGIAMGGIGSEVAKQAADVVLLDDNFASIVDGVEEGRAVFSNIRKFLTYVLVHNVAELVPYLVFALVRIPLPLTPIQVLMIDMGTDSLTAVGLGAEAPDPSTMRRPPRAQHERLFNLATALRAYLFLGVMEAAAAMAAYLYVMTGEGWRLGQQVDTDDPMYLRATTACMGAIIVMQLVNVFLCRSAWRSLRDTGLGGNKWILWGVMFQVLLLVLIVYTPIGNLWLGTHPLPWTVWLFIVPFAVAMVVLEEARKAWVRFNRRRRADC